MDQPAIDEEEVEPRPLLIGPASLLLGKAAGKEALPALLDLLRPAALLLTAIDPGSGDPEDLANLRRLANNAAAALLIEDNLDLSADADGCHLNDSGAVKAARERLGEDGLIGVEALSSRHDAMTAGDEGADYVAFGRRDAALTQDIVELVRWWRAMTVLPCLAYARDVEAVKTLRDAGADFIGVSSLIFEHPEGAASAARDLGEIFQNS